MFIICIINNKKTMKTFDTEILDKVNFPKDLKPLSIQQLEKLADEIRQILIYKINETGGHMGPNLGFIEPTIALHYVFDAPKDKLVFDIAHQCYTHKILTGRKDGYLDETKYHKYCGFTDPAESEYDLFKIGHTSTSISLATGLAKARDIKGTNENVIAIIGDGSLTGGEAYEGLNIGAVLDSNFIVVINDNGISIAENQGGLDRHLKHLKETKGEAKDNMFKALGYDYIYVENGNSIKDLIEAFEKVKNIDHPVVIHLKTLKGKGLAVAEQNKEKFHWIMPHTLDNQNTTTVESYNSITNDYLLKQVESGENIIVVSPATPGASGLYKDIREKFGKNYIDVGIAEQQAVAFISGAGKNGTKAVLQVMSSFIQRSYDQLSQDWALNNNPAVMLVYGGCISGADATHLGIFDIPLISNIPNIVYLAPTTKQEHLAMLKWAIKQNQYPVAIRMPIGQLISSNIEDTTDYSQINKFKVVENGEKVAIVGAGNFFHLGQKVKQQLSKHSINATLINPCFISGIDKQLLEQLKQNHSLIITLEDGAIEGGFGQKIASFYGNSNMKVLNFGADKVFSDRVPLEELYKQYHLTEELIVKDVLNSL